jgi:transposase-like protein
VLALWKRFCVSTSLVGAFCASTGTAASTASSVVEHSRRGDAMTKAEQTRLTAWRFRVLQRAGEASRNVASTCRHFGISRKTFYKWKRRHAEHGAAGLCDRSPPAPATLEDESSSVIDLLGIYTKKIERFLPDSFRSPPFLICGDVARDGCVWPDVAVDKQGLSRVQGGVLRRASRVAESRSTLS